MNDILTAYRQYAEFQGRSGRRAFWYFLLFFVVVAAILSVLDNMMFGGMLTIDSGPGWSMTDGFQPLTSIFAIVSLVPTLAVTVRRLHDTGKTGWWALVGLIPLIGWIWVLILCAGGAEVGPNAFGDAP